MRVLTAIGTRPEKIKVAPVVDALRERGVEVVEWCSGQSRDLIVQDDHASRRFNNGWNFGMIAGVAETMRCFEAELAFAWHPFDAVIVQGDTATAFACAQAAFLAKVPVAHVEAGLRTYAAEPWPEEAFRRQIAAVAKWHFAPDQDAADNLYSERGWNPTNCTNGDGGVYVTGNTVIDTLPKVPLRVLVTLHRRENWGDRIRGALGTLDDFAQQDGVTVTAISHPNWKHHVWAPGLHFADINFVDPMPREELLDHIQSVDLIVTDSGGLQEEAAHFGIDCLVLRTSTERVGLLSSGAVVLVDPDAPEALKRALESRLAKRRQYGIGDAGARIAAILVEQLKSGS